MNSANIRKALALAKQQVQEPLIKERDAALTRAVAAESTRSMLAAEHAGMEVELGQANEESRAKDELITDLRSSLQKVEARNARVREAACQPAQRTARHVRRVLPVITAVDRHHGSVVVGGGSPRYRKSFVCYQQRLRFPPGPLAFLPSQLASSGQSQRAPRRSSWGSLCTRGPSPLRARHVRAYARPSLARSDLASGWSPEGQVQRCRLERRRHARHIPGFVALRHEPDERVVAPETMLSRNPHSTQLVQRSIAFGQAIVGTGHGRFPAAERPAEAWYRGRRNVPDPAP